MRELLIKVNRKWLALLLLPFAVVVVYFLFFRNGATVKPKRGPVVVAVYSLGTVTADNVFSFKAGLTASIQDIYVREGDAVGRGQKLLLLDSGAVVSAPFGGTITKVAFQKGEIVMPGVPVLTLIDLKNRHILVSLDQESALRVKPGQKVQISFETMRGQKFSGTVERLYPQNGQFIARIKSELPADALPEMTADVAIETERKENSILIPAETIVESHVMRVRNHVRQKVKVETGAADGEWIEITNNVIEDNDEILIQKK